VEPVQTRAPTDEARRVNKVLKNIKDGQEELQTEWGLTPEDFRPSLETKTKFKTRSDKFSIENEFDAMSLSSKTQASTIDTPEQAEEKVTVKEKALATFRALFPQGDGGLKCVTWDSFINAMGKVGFEARRSGGSAVMFEPNGESKWFGKGKIVIHRPHPNSDIDQVMLLSIGKRMKKWFGWNRESFALEGKKK
jgi:HicA toxin of bacterial toxin-antitoxin,